MNENIDLTKILKNCPIGTKLYLTLCGEVKLIKVENDTYPICIENSNGDRFWLTQDGKHISGLDGECILFPSKEQRDWSKFTAPWYKKDKSVEPKFKAGDMVRHKYTNKDDVYEISKVYDDSYGIAGFNWMILMKYQDQYELVHNKFDPKTLLPFDKVLTRIDSEHHWQADIFSHHCNKFTYCITGYKAAVIPFNDETKHLLGTSDEAPEYYRYWEN